VNHKLKPERDLAHILPKVQMPGRYTGGEFGTYPPVEEGELLIVVCFPDLYEIGMSNLAIKLLYRELNEIPGVRCERVFAPAPDFETLLRQKGLPLYTLESGTPLHHADIVGVSVGYELAFTSIFSVLESGGISLHAAKRNGNEPLILAGGPAISNPEPFAPFFDGIYFGEAEAVFTKLAVSLRDAKQRGAGREGLLEICRESEYILSEAQGTAGRAVWDGFDCLRPGMYPVPNIDVVQDHGVVEIMRGCPNGCRFCHAGFYYRPFREKSFSVIEGEVEYLVHELGYREITLSSLSTGDYHGLHDLVRRLHRRWGKYGVSFALPSLKVDSFTLPLLQEISRVRKSGLTFAVETPELEWQRGINKDVNVEKVVQILKEARERGWNMAKFYFMIGLPPHLYGGREEEEADSIASFLQQVRDETGFKINANVGTFIPKPHTPYQWSRQLTEEQALERIQSLKNRFRKSQVRISYHSPFISFLEGIISRGDKRAGTLALEAYRRGARLDAWEEHLDTELWRRVIEEADWNVEQETCRARDIEEALPWDRVDTGLEKQYLQKERHKSERGEMTNACEFPCDHNCGVCRYDRRPRIGEGEQETTDNETNRNGEPIDASVSASEQLSEGAWHIFSFSKQGKAAYLSHINVMNIFTRALQRAGIRTEYTQGYNPKPRLEFAQPLALGISSEAEIGRVKLLCTAEGLPLEDELCAGINAKLPEGIRVHSFKACSGRSGTGKGVSLMPFFGGATYAVTPRVENIHERQRRSEKLRRRASEAGIPEKLVYPGETDGEVIFEVPSVGEEAYKLKEFVRSFSEFSDFLSEHRVHRSNLWTFHNETFDKERGSYIRLFTQKTPEFN